MTAHPKLPHQKHRLREHTNALCDVGITRDRKNRKIQCRGEPYIDESASGFVAAMLISCSEPSRPLGVEEREFITPKETEGHIAVREPPQEEKEPGWEEAEQASSAQAAEHDEL